MAERVVIIQTLTSDDFLKPTTSAPALSATIQAEQTESRHTRQNHHAKAN